jgi:hypothetical protein
MHVTAITRTVTPTTDKTIVRVELGLSGKEGSIEIKTAHFPSVVRTKPVLHLVQLVLSDLHSLQF